MKEIEERFFESIKELQSFTVDEIHDIINYKELDGYEKRVSTFSKVEWWFAKLKSQNPREIARYGWELYQKELLYCPFCKSQIKLIDNDKYQKIRENNDNNEEITENFTSLLKNAHENMCIWTLEEIPEFYSLIPKSLSILILNLLQNKNKTKIKISFSFVTKEYLKLCLLSYLPFPSLRFTPLLPSSLPSLLVRSFNLF